MHYYICLSVKGRFMEDSYTQEDLFGLARAQTEITLYEDESHAESEAQLLAKQKATNYLVCRVSVRDDVENEDLNDTQVTAGKLDYHEVVSLHEKTEAQIEEAEKQETIVPQSVRKPFVPPTMMRPSHAVGSRANEAQVALEQAHENEQQEDDIASPVASVSAQFPGFISALTLHRQNLAARAQAAADLSDVTSDYSSPRTKKH